MVSCLRAADATSSVDAEETLELVMDGEEGADGAYEEEEVEVELEDGQFEVRADLPGFEDIPFVMEDNNESEFTEEAIAALEASPELAEVRPWAAAAATAARGRDG